MPSTESTHPTGLGGTLRLRCPSGSQGQLRHHLHQTCASNGMDGLTQVFLHNFKNTYIRGEFISAQVAPSADIRSHFCNTGDQPRPTLHPV